MVAPIQKGKNKIPQRNILLNEDLLHRGTPYSPWTYATAEHPTHRGPAPLRNTLLTLDLPHRRTPYSQWTCPTAEHPTHCGPAPPRNTLLTLDLPHSGAPYSPWTCPTAEHPTHRGPNPRRNTQLTLDLPHMKHPNHFNGKRPLKKIARERDRHQTDITHQTREILILNEPITCSVPSVFFFYL